MLDHYKKYRKIALWSSISLFLIALTQDSYCTTSGCGNSLMSFLLGWLAIFFSAAAVSWIANPLLILSWVTIRINPKISWYSSIAAFVLASSFMLFDKIIDNEAGHFNEIISYGLGYKLWLFSITIVFIWNFLLQQELKKRGISQKRNPFEL